MHWRFRIMANEIVTNVCKSKIDRPKISVSKPKPARFRSVDFASLVLNKRNAVSENKSCVCACPRYVLPLPHRPRPRSFQLLSLLLPSCFDGLEEADPVARDSFNLMSDHQTFHFTVVLTNN